MRIYSMTATFGKLEHQTLRLEPGLNIIEAPNEWGKSTWCSFLITMLYGLDTRERTKKNALADKERFAPWSGSPMSGRIDLNWNGRDITIERRSKGRIPMGELQAYETATGVEIPELTAATCGEVLLGVERNVFTRSAFIRSGDMPVTEDEDLRRRLNALVTTGDESGTAQELEQKLKALKNRFRYNKKGLLPEAMEQHAALTEKRSDHDTLTTQALRLRRHRAELEQQLSDLSNHEAALRHAAALEDLRRVEAAAAARDKAKEQYQAALSACDALPSREQALQALEQKAQQESQRQELLQKEKELPPIPTPPQPPEPFRDIDPEEVLHRAQSDEDTLYTLDLPLRSGATPFCLAGIAAIGAGVAVTLLLSKIIGLCTVVAGLGLILTGVLLAMRAGKTRAKLRARRDALCRRYGNDDPAQWQALARRYQIAVERYRVEEQAARTAREALDALRHQLEQQAAEDSTDYHQVLRAWDTLRIRQESLEQAEQNLATLQAMATTAPPPTRPDSLTLSAQQTQEQSAAITEQLRQIHQRLGQCQGQMALLGDRETLCRQISQLETRIHRLEQTNQALDLALQALSQAQAELQRRFAPRITKQAQNLFSRLTAGRYDRLTMTQDLSVQAGAAGEDTLRNHLWRSDGTIDQLYLSMRLAVARELTPEAPLILDDALARVDQQRLTSAIQILNE